MLRWITAGLIGLSGLPACAADYLAGPTDYRRYLPRLEAGDRLRLEPGTYLEGLPLRDLAGLPGQPIVIEAADASAPPRLMARRGANTVSLVNVRHVTVRGLELDGGGLPVDAVKAEGHSRYADFVVLEDLYIHDHAASQQSVGISTKCPALGWTIRGNRITRVGTGLYLGNSDGGAPFVGGLIEANRIDRTLGYNLQIKHQNGRPADWADGHDTIIRYNVFSKQDAQPNPLARPNVLLGHFPPEGPGAVARYLIYGNQFLSNPSEALLQSEARMALYDNLFVNEAGDAIRVQPHNGAPRDMAIFSNTVVASGAGIRIRQAPDAPYRQRLIANLVSAAQPIAGGEAAHNRSLPYRPAWADRPDWALTGRMLAAAPSPAPLPDALQRSLADDYPDWPARAHPGARSPEPQAQRWP
ncbi:MAG: hypothetical protein ABS91_00965 [Thiobacillus sp. SCN 64-35]|nr:hypothetical protein [Thiobacillus sp.]ODU13571.1 MAG: hypothetical protein ABS91_00965 [Thiobacillus sp. SCN 64-35]ODU90632.1 MAG: hypothetical protein ABT21_00870 [Thiobacillus sp. SCN 65-179]OJW35940.1 MAG: hypothetical protein BGO61_08330 [Thiobacillus sp. 65-69]